MMKEFVQEQYFKVDGKNLPLDYEQTFWLIPEHSSRLLSQISVTVEEDVKGLFEDYYDDGHSGRKLKITFEALGIFQNGLTNGEVRFDEDKNSSDHTYFNKEGFEFTLRFYGTITYRENWVFVDGELKTPYGDTPKFTLQAAVQFDPDVLDWSNYLFKSLKETATADPLIVKKLEIINPTFTSLPDEVYDFKNLSHLSIIKLGDYFDNSKLPFTNFDARIGTMKDLASISINKASVQHLPEEIGLLKKLESLSINLCSLQDLPASLWSLPKLKHLYLFGNQIKEIPETIELPSLRTLDLKDNLLKTLPSSLTVQPELTSILAKGNPLAHLPKAFNDFKGLEISIEDKKKLLDNTYPGANGQGILTWDNNIYTAESDRELIAPVEEIIQKNGLTQEREALLSIVKKAVGFEQFEEEDYQTLGNHRFGGFPDLPLDKSFPSFYDDYLEKTCLYEFIAQINCEELAGLQDYLPKTGTLFFFFKSFQLFGYDNEDLAKVIYVADNGTLDSGNRFDYKEEDFFELIDGQYRPYKAKAFKVNAAPSFYAHKENQYLFEGDAKTLENQEKLLHTLYKSFEQPVMELKKFDHAINCYGFTQHESPELQASLTWKGNPQDWIILLLVKSIGDFQWGDAGDLFFVIHKSDLARKDFSKIFVTLESS